MTHTHEEELFLYEMFKENEQKEFNEWVARMEQDSDMLQLEMAQRQVEKVGKLFDEILFVGDMDKWIEKASNERIQLENEIKQIASNF